MMLNDYFPTPPFRECVLHIGREKTGSTSFQAFLDLNARALRSRGWFVPASPAPHAGRGMRNHLRIATACIEPAPADLWTYAGLVPPFDVSAQRHAVMDALSAEIYAHAGDCPNLLLSNEHLSSRIRNVDGLRLLRELVMQLAERVRVVAYLRPQHEMAQALFSTALYNGVTVARPLPVFAGPGDIDRVIGVDRETFDHGTLLGKYASVFGPRALQPRLYTPDALVNRDIIDDLLSVLGVDAEGLLRPGRLNSGFDADGQRFMLWLNQKLAIDPLPDAKRLQLCVGFALSASASGPGLRPGYSQTKAFLGHYAAGNEAIRKRWFPERPILFDTDLAVYPNRADEAFPVPARVFARFAQVMMVLPHAWQQDGATEHF